MENKISENKALVSEHGLSFFVEGAGFSFFFDLGSCVNTLSNAHRLGVPLEKAEAVVLSHSHYDHAAGYRDYVESGKAPKVLYTGPHFFEQKYASNGVRYTNLSCGFDEAFLQSQGIRHEEIPESKEIFPGVHIFTSFARTHSFETIPKRFVKKVGDTDSCSDLSVELMERYDIDYCRMNTIYHGKEIPASLSWDSYSSKEFYDTMRGGERIITNQVPVAEFKRVFGQYAPDYDLIYIGCCIKQSASVSTGAVVAKEIMTSNASSRIEVIDSLNASLGEGLLAVEAAKMVQSGESYETIISTIKGIRKNVNEYCTVHSLEWLHKSGRVKASAAFFGNLMGVKPILIADKNGVQTPIKKVKGRVASFKEIVSLMAEAIDDNADLWMVTADCSEGEVAALRRMAEEKMPGHLIHVLPMGPIIGASCGPETIGLWALGKPVTYVNGEA